MIFRQQSNESYGNNFRMELEKMNPDVVFTTDSDCEILLHLYKEHGPDFLSKVRYHFVLAFREGFLSSLVLR